MSKKKVISTVSLKSAQKKSQNALIKYLNKLINENAKKRNTSISVDFDIDSAVLAFYKEKEVLDTIKAAGGKKENISE